MGLSSSHPGSPLRQVAGFDAVCQVFAVMMSCEFSCSMCLKWVHDLHEHCLFSCWFFHSRATLRHAQADTYWLSAATLCFVSSQCCSHFCACGFVGLCSCVHIPSVVLCQVQPAAHTVWSREDSIGYQTGIVMKRISIIT